MSEQMIGRLVPPIRDLAFPHVVKQAQEPKKSRKKPLFFEPPSHNLLRQLVIYDQQKHYWRTKEELKKKHCIALHNDSFPYRTVYVKSDIVYPDKTEYDGKASQNPPKNLGYG